MKEVQPIRSADDRAKITQAMIDDGNYRDLLLFNLGIRTGLRISDLLAMKWDLFVDTEALDKWIGSLNTLDKREIAKISNDNRKVILDKYILPVDSDIEIIEKKTHKKKWFPLMETIRENLVSYLSTILNSLFFEKSTGKFIFESRNLDKDGNKKAISRVYAWKMLNKYVGKAKLDIHVGTHTLRKTFGYYQYSTGTNIAYVMNMLNHSSEAHTLRYIGIERDTMRQMYHKMG
jgi:integrase